MDYRCDQYRQKIAELHNNIAKLERDLEQQQVYLEVRGVRLVVLEGVVVKYNH